jgi:hypothetical protein
MSEYSLERKVMMAFNRAVTLPENQYEDGSINWDFVDADLCMDDDLREMDDDDLQSWFFFLADDYERPPRERLVSA